MGLFDFFRKKGSSTEPSKEKPKKTYTKFCPKCGIGIEETTEKCPHCGKMINEGEVIKTIHRNGVTVEVSKPAPGVKTLGKYTRNGITYVKEERIDDTGLCVTIDIPEYNEVYYFFKFLTKYPIIKAPQYIQPGNYSSWYFWKEGIKDYITLHKTLVSRGFYSRATNEEILSTYKVGEIKELITQLGITAKGKKDDLIQGVISQTDEGTLNRLLGDQLQSISEMGEQWMETHQEEYDYYTAEDEFPSFDAYKSFWSEHDPEQEKKKKLLREIATDKQSFGRYAYDGLISIYKKKEGMEKEIMLCLLKELMLDLSGAMSYYDWKHYLSLGGDPSELHAMIDFTPYLMKTIPKYKSFYEESLADKAYELNLPVKVCDLATFKEIIEIILDGAMDQDTINDYRHMLIGKAKEFVKTLKRS